MEKDKDTYHTIDDPTEEVLFKDRKSKFYGLAFPVSDEEQIKEILTDLRKKYANANHVCYAWQLGTKTIIYRANDDGEPNNSAGMPIYGQIQAFEVTNILIAVIRFFGGTKLGVGGLISAYRTAAQQTLNSAKIVEKIITVRFSLQFGYPQLDIVMRTIKQNGFEIVSQEMHLDCQLTIQVREKEADRLQEYFEGLQGIEIKPI
ncbi:YigZ family protein [Euzebyella marina]|uniref:YigZ family protein n=1 Tax=Euzebyella marina TaxID=1761453 RepID=A0A3G2L6G8_9FLAO|nr:YigZ family protein [Euzebyella marina]AYN67872.1 YigZ family protein [Euzebyella marina]MBG49483.1 YigZ family protein [Pseudozobellia sp.]|tara:strand:- start:331051 stop:331662 length:612 start_codon:yes stop_codon:yes gene_type:complete